MRIRIIIEDDEGRQIGEGTVPVESPREAATRQLMEAIGDLARQMRERQPVLPNVPTWPYVPHYPYAPHIQPTILWCGRTSTSATDAPSPNTTAGSTHEA